MKTMAIDAVEFDSAGEALQYADADGRGRAVRCGGRHLVVEESEIERMEAAGVEFALLADREMADGTFRILTIPVND